MGMMKRQWSFDYKYIGSVRFQFVLILAILACVLSAGAQTLNSSQVGNSGSSSNLSGLVNSKRGSSGFGAADAEGTGAVDAGLQSYSGSVGVDAGTEFTGGLANSSHRSKTSASVQKLLLGGSEPTKQSQDVQGMRSRGIRDLDGLSQKGIASLTLTGGATQSVGGTIALSEMMQSGSPSGIEEEKPASEGAVAMESGTAAEETTTSTNGLESVGDPFKSSEGASFESLCGEGCGRSGGFGPAEGRRGTENREQALAHHLSRSVARLSLLNSASSENSRKLSGRLATGAPKLPGGSWSAAQLSVGGGSSDQR
jgi:hypothetical protein